jgi:hypothetical protein
MSQDFSKKISIVINKDLPAWQAMNTLAHISAYFGHYLGADFGTGDFFTTSDMLNIPRNTQYPIIVFETDTKGLHHFAVTSKTFEDVQKMYFTKEMIETTDDSEIVTITNTKAFDDLEFLGVGLFGDNAAVKKYMAKFKLWS